jgi:hypothetical protein
MPELIAKFEETRQLIFNVVVPFQSFSAAETGREWSARIHGEILAGIRTCNQ